MKNIWEELAISPTMDVAAIKSAYAKRLKLTRPDEDPVAFQNLHASYKAALSSVKSQQVSSKHEISAPSITEEQNPSIVETNDSLLSISEIETTDVAKAQTQLADSAIDNLLEQCDEVLNQGAGQYDPRAWSFLSEDSSIIDPYVNQVVGRDIFNSLATYNARLTGRRKKRHQIHESVLKYLDEIFNWSSLGYYYGDDSHEDLFNQLVNSVSKDDSGPNVDKALSGVRGARVIKSKGEGYGGIGKKRPDQEAYAANQDLGHAAIMIGSLATILIGCVGYFDIENYNDRAGWTKFIILFVPYIPLMAICVGVFKRNLIGFYGMWVIVLIMVPFFPVGTLLGWFLGVKLNKAKGLYSD